MNKILKRLQKVADENIDNNIDIDIDEIVDDFINSKERKTYKDNVADMISNELIDDNYTIFDLAQADYSALVEQCEEVARESINDYAERIADKNFPNDDEKAEQLKQKIYDGIVYNEIDG